MAAAMEGHVSSVGKNLSELPQTVQQWGPKTTHLDLTDNKISSPNGFEHLTRLTDLILDKNGMESLPNFPVMKSVETLWLNNNKLSDLVATVASISKTFPNLTYLSMLKNPACPDIYFDDAQAEAYQRYRYYVIYALQKLNFLDATPVADEERKEANRTGPNLKIAAPDPSQYESKGKKPDPLAADLTTKNDAPLAKPAAFLARGRLRYDGSHSEGNRFIVNEDL